MRVAFLAGHLSRRASGVRQMVEGLSGALAARGLEIQVFGISDAAWESGDAQAWRGAEAHTFRPRGPRSFAFMPGLAPALRAFAPDIVHLHGLWMYSAAVAAKWASRPDHALVISPHGMLAPAALAYSSTKKRFIGAMFQNRCFARASGYHATAEAEAADIRNYLGDVPVGVIPNGVEKTTVPLPNWSSRSRRVVAIGRLHPVKGYDRLLRAWANVEPEAPGWSLEIAGPDPTGHGAELRKLIAELGLTRAKIGAARFGAERDALIASSRLFVLPSLTENFALTVPEALICGTPVLASTGSPWEALPQQGCGWWVAPEPEPLAAALRQATRMSDKELAAMGEAGKAWASQTFHWDGLAARMTDFYRSLLQEDSTS